MASQKLPNRGLGVYASLRCIFRRVAEPELNSVPAGFNIIMPE
jgi:hypothetical protein